MRISCQTFNYLCMKILQIMPFETAPFLEKKPLNPNVIKLFYQYSVPNGTKKIELNSPAKGE